MEEIKKCLEEFPPYCYQRSILETLINDNEIYKARCIARKLSYETNDDKITELLEEFIATLISYRPPEPPPRIQKTPKCESCNQKRKDIHWVNYPTEYRYEWLWMCEDCDSDM